MRDKLNSKTPACHVGDEVGHFADVIAALRLDLLLDNHRGCDTDKFALAVALVGTGRFIVMIEHEREIGTGFDVGQTESQQVFMRKTATGDDCMYVRQKQLGDFPVQPAAKGAHCLRTFENRHLHEESRQNRSDIIDQKFFAPVDECDATLI